MKSGTLQNACSTSQKMDAVLGKSALMHIARLKNSQSLFYKTKEGCKLGEKCSYARRRVDEQPSKRSKKNGDKSTMGMLKSTRQLVCVCQEMEPPAEIFVHFTEEPNVLKPIRCVQFTKAVLRHANIRKQKKHRLGEDGKIANARRSSVDG